MPDNKSKKKEDDSLELISNTGLTLKKIDNVSINKVTNKGEQLTNILKYICNLANENNISTRKLWLEELLKTLATTYTSIATKCSASLNTLMNDFAKEMSKALKDVNDTEGYNEKDARRAAK